MPPLSHLILTRFAVKSAGVGFQGSFPPGWIEGRIDLFRRFCLPTIKAQTCQNFRWLLLCHADFEEHWEAQLTSMWDRIEVARSWRPSALPDWAENEIVLTTRLDSDDGLHERYVEKMQAAADQFAASPENRIIYNFPKGFKLHSPTGKVYNAYKPNSAFFTMMEKQSATTPVSALGGNHSHMHKEHPTTQDESMRGWVMVVHGGNVINGIGARDTPIPGGSLDDGFSSIVAGNEKRRRLFRRLRGQ